MCSSCVVVVVVIVKGDQCLSLLWQVGRSENKMRRNFKLKLSAMLFSAF